MCYDDAEYYNQLYILCFVIKYLSIGAVSVVGWLLFVTDAFKEHAAFKGLCI